MENEKEKLEAEAAAAEKEVYVPRPAWQVWAARVGLVLFILFVIFQYVKIYRGGF